MPSLLPRFLMITALTLLLAACGSKLTQENYSKIASGMTQAEVVKILGEPQSAEGGGVFGITAGTSVWKDEKHQITIVFLNDKVTSKMFGDVQETSVK